jgi:hypothetical protein
VGIDPRTYPAAAETAIEIQFNALLPSVVHLTTRLVRASCAGRVLCGDSDRNIMDIGLRGTTVQDTRRWAAVCGRNCDDCAEAHESCKGCAYQLGFPHAAECAVFRCCAVERGLEHCGLCPDFACQVFLALDTPLQSAKRYRALARRAEIGTDAWLAEHADCKKSP